MKTDKKHPEVFISYSWDSEEHKKWVRELATRLRHDGVDVTLDQWHAQPGDKLPQFMERAIRESDFVLIVCSSNYKLKSDGRTGGSGYEGDIMTGEALTDQTTRKFIPLLRSNEWSQASPSWLLGNYYIDFRGNPFSELCYKELMLTICKQRSEPPPLGRAPDPLLSFTLTEVHDKLSIQVDGIDLATQPEIGWGTEQIRKVSIQIQNESSYILEVNKVSFGLIVPTTYIEMPQLDEIIPDNEWFGFYLKDSEKWVLTDKLLNCDQQALSNNTTLFSFVLQRELRLKEYETFNVALSLPSFYKWKKLLPEQADCHALWRIPCSIRVFSSSLPKDYNFTLLVPWKGRRWNYVRHNKAVHTDGNSAALHSRR